MKRAVYILTLAVVLLAGLFLAGVRVPNPQPAKARVAGPTATGSTLYIAPTGSDSNSCTQAAPCKSMNGAYLKAAGGDIILIRSGSYGSQTVNDRGAGVGQVVFHPAPGESATFLDGTVFAQNVTIDGGDQVGVNETNRLTFTQGLDLQMPNANSGDRNLIAEDIHAESTFINAWSTTLRYSEIGPLNVCAGRSDDLVKGWWFSVNGQDQGIQRLKIMNNDIHDNHDEGCSAGNPHNDAIQMEGDNSVVSGNRIWWCGTQCIFQGYDGKNDIVENNMIEESNNCTRCGDSSEVGFAGTTIFRYNTVDGSVTFGGGAIPANATVQNNLFLAPGACDSSATYSNNVYPATGGSTCGTGATRGTPLFTSGKWNGSDLQAQYYLSPNDTVAYGKAGANTNSPVVTTTSSTTTAPTTTAQTTTAPTTTTTGDTVKTLLQNSIADLKQSGGYKNWARANPGESTAIDAWVADNSKPLPTPKTYFGKAYLEEQQALSKS